MQNPWILLSGVLVLLGNVPYIFAILRKETVPNRASWWIWSGVNLLVMSTYWSLGGTAALGLGIGGLIGQITIAVLSIRYGTGGVNAIDRTCIIGAVCSALLWWATSSALLAHVLGVFMDFLGWLPTFQKTRKQPQSEDLFSWVLWTAGAAVAFLSIETWSVSSALFPVYLLVSDTIVLSMIAYHRLMARRRMT